MIHLPIKYPPPHEVNTTAVLMAFHEWENLKAFYHQIYIGWVFITLYVFILL